MCSTLKYHFSGLTVSNRLSYTVAVIVSPSPLSFVFDSLLPFGMASVAAIFSMSAFFCDTVSVQVSFAPGSERLRKVRHAV